MKTEFDSFLILRLMRCCQGGIFYPWNVDQVIGLVQDEVVINTCLMRLFVNINEDHGWKGVFHARNS